LVGLVVFGGTDEETGYKNTQCAFLAGFSKETCLSAWEKVDAVQCTWKCLSDPKVSKAFGDSDNKYYNLIQVANDLTIHTFTECGS
jgi:hypothetical protein